MFSCNGNKILNTYIYSYSYGISEVQQSEMKPLVSESSWYNNAKLFWWMGILYFLHGCTTTGTDDCPWLFSEKLCTGIIQAYLHLTVHTSCTWCGHFHLLLHSSTIFIFYSHWLCPQEKGTVLRENNLQYKHLLLILQTSYLKQLKLPWKKPNIIPFNPLIGMLKNRNKISYDTRRQTY